MKEVKINPYNSTRPGNLFVGYKYDINKIITGFINGCDYAILGGRRCGKTSFLIELEKSIKDQNFEPYSPITSRFSIQELGKVTSNTLFEKIYNLITKDIQVNQWLEQEEGKEYQYFLNLLKDAQPSIVRKYGHRWMMILLIDEIDAAGNYLHNDAFFQELRNFLMESDYSKHFRIAASGVVELSKLISSGTSPLSNFRNIYLKILNNDDAKKLIGIGYSNINETEIEKILKITGKHPFLMQGILEKLWNFKEIDKASIDKACEEFLNERNDFQYWLKAFKVSERSVYELLAKAPNNKMPYESIIKQVQIPAGHKGEVFNTLSYHGVIDNSNPKEPEISSTLFRDWYLNEIQTVDDIVFESSDYKDSDKTNNISTYSSEAANEKELKDKLQYSILSVEIENFLCIKKLLFQLYGNERWIFLLGENGDGKTAFLQALAIGVCGASNAKKILKNNKHTKITVELSKNCKKHKNYIFWYEKLNTWTGANVQPDFFCAYGPSRLDIQGDTQIGQEIEDIDPEINLLEQKGNLRNIENWAMRQKLRAENDDKAGIRLQKVLDLLFMLMPNISKIKLVGDKLSFYEKNYWASLNEVASGHKTILATIGDIIIRLFEMQPDIVEPDQLSGIVVIDEIDIHLHPTYQRILPGLLNKIFPKIQFICSTHSPIPLLSAPKGSKIFVVDRNKESGTDIVEAKIDVSRITPNAILTSPLFGLNNIFSDSLKNIENLDPEDNYNDIQDRHKIESKIMCENEDMNHIPDEWFT